MEVGDVSLATGNRLYFSKKNEESGSLSDSPLDPLLLVFLFFTDASASYFDRQTNLLKSATQIVTIDTLIAVLAGLMIFPWLCRRMAYRQQNAKLGGFQQRTSRTNR